jgi:hypothetical protein
MPMRFSPSEEPRSNEGASQDVLNVETLSADAQVNDCVIKPAPASRTHLSAAERFSHSETQNVAHGLIENELNRAAARPRTRTKVETLLEELPSIAHN